MKIHGLGQFVIVKRAARQGRHPRTGEVLAIPETVAVKFRPWQPLRVAAQKAARQPALHPRPAKAAKAKGKA